MCVRSIPVRPLRRGVGSGAFAPFPCPQGVVGFVRVRSVYSRSPLSSRGSFVNFRAIPVDPGGWSVLSGAFSSLTSPLMFAFCPFTCALGIVEYDRSLPVCPRGHRVRSCAFGPFPCAPDIVGFVRLRRVHPRAPWGSSCSCGCVRSIPVRPGGNRVRSCAVCPFQCALGVVVFFRTNTPRGSSGSVRCDRSVTVRAGMRSVHFRSSWVSSCSFWCVFVHSHALRCVISGAFGPFPFALWVVGFVRVAFGRFPRALEVYGFVRVGSVHFRAPW